MDNNDDYLDDDGFVNYVPTTVDPGFVFLLVTTLFCIATHAILPCLVTLGKRYEKRKIARESGELRSESMDAASEQPQVVAAIKERTTAMDGSRRSGGDQNVDSSPSPSGSNSKGATAGPDAHTHTWKSLLDQVRFLMHYISWLGVAFH